MVEHKLKGIRNYLAVPLLQLIWVKGGVWVQRYTRVHADTELGYYLIFGHEYHEYCPVYIRFRLAGSYLIRSYFDQLTLQPLQHYPSHYPSNPLF